MKEINACGLTCPEPVLKAKEIIDAEQPNSISVLVDNVASSENVSRFLTSKGYWAQKEQNGENYLIRATRDGKSITEESIPPPYKSADVSYSVKTVVLITGDKMGAGDDKLGRKLMINYIKTIKELGDDLWQLIFVNSGVKLTTSSSPVLAEIKEYEDAGCIVLACGTCLEHFDLMAEKKVGKTTNMLDIVMAGQAADKFISIG